jgi:hypothetical protein
MMMTYNELCAKLILEKTKNSKSENKSKNIFGAKKWMNFFFPFLYFKLDLTTSTDWDLDS